MAALALVLQTVLLTGATRLASGRLFGGSTVAEYPAQLAETTAVTWLVIAALAVGCATGLLALYRLDRSASGPGRRWPVPLLAVLCAFHAALGMALLSVPAWAAAAPLLTAAALLANLVLYRWRGTPSPQSAPPATRTGPAPLLLVGLVALLTVTVNRAVDLGSTTPFAQLAAAVQLATAGYAVLLVVTLRRQRVVALVAGCGLVVHLGWLDGTWWPTEHRTPGAAGRPPLPVLTVLTVNAHLGQVDAGQLVRTVRDRRVDLLSVVELTPALTAGLTAAGLDQLLPSRVVDPRSRAAGAGLWSRYRLEAAEAVGQTTFVTPRALVHPPTGPVSVLAVHACPPLPGLAGRWGHDLAVLRQATDTRTPAVLLGDFNATTDHAAFRELLTVGLSDTLDQTGAGPAPTWPAVGRFPGLLRLDHVLVSEHLVATEATTLALPGTDHRAVLSRLARRDPTRIQAS